MTTPRVFDWTGKKIGKLTITKKTDTKDSAGYFIYECTCDCGNQVKRTASALNQAIKKNNNSSCPDCKKALQSEIALRVNQMKRENKAS